MGELLRRGTGPAIAVRGSETVLAAARLMDQSDVGAVVVEENGTMIGIFSERDLLRRVVAAGRDPGATRVFEVMSCPVLAASSAAERDEVVEAMVVRHIRHVPVVDRAGRPVGMFSFRGAMSERIEDLEHEVDVLSAYLGYDGVSG